MKKTVTLAFAAILAVAAIQSQGAAILWSISTGALKGVGTAGESGTYADSTSNLGGAALYFYLGSTTDDLIKAAIGADGKLNTSSLGTSATWLETTTSKGGGNKVAGTTPVVNDGISATSANNFFFIAVTAVGDSYAYKMVTGSQKGYDSTDTLATPTQMTFTTTAVQSSSWTQVPEPSTAALALAGLALLLKRRKA